MLSRFSLPDERRTNNLDSSRGRVEELNQGPPDFKSSALNDLATLPFQTFQTLGQTDMQTDGMAFRDRQTERETSRQTDRQPDRETSRQTDRQTDGPDGK